jgi:hypothetical protein
MKKLITIFGAIFFASLISTSCGPKKHDYPSDVTQNFMNSCQETSGGDQKMCSCLLDKIQEKYSYEEFSAIEVKMQAGQTPQEFLDFVGKARAECSKK